jgi:alkylated DNA nucleotide flippase Atl1
MMDAPIGFAEAAAQVRPGEWTTYGDIAAAAGRPCGARMVGRAAATSGDFPNAHRVLRADGTISRGAGDRGRAGEERARGLLEAEEVRFSPDGKADPTARVYWDELERRLKRKPSATASRRR